MRSLRSASRSSPVEKAIGGVVHADIADNLRAALLCHGRSLPSTSSGCPTEGTTFAMPPLLQSGHVSREFVARHGPALHDPPEAGPCFEHSRVARSGSRRRTPQRGMPSRNPRRAIHSRSAWVAALLFSHRVADQRCHRRVRRSLFELRSGVPQCQSGSLPPVHALVH